MEVKGGMSTAVIISRLEEKGRVTKHRKHSVIKLMEATSSRGSIFTLDIVFRAEGSVSIKAERKKERYVEEAWRPMTNA
jgi:hypothetical protein